MLVFELINYTLISIHKKILSTCSGKTSSFTKISFPNSMSIGHTQEFSTHACLKDENPKLHEYMAQYSMFCVELGMIITFITGWKHSLWNLVVGNRETRANIDLLSCPGGGCSVSFGYRLDLFGFWGERFESLWIFKIFSSVSIRVWITCLN